MIAGFILIPSAASGQRSTWGPWNALKDGNKNGVDISFRWVQGNSSFGLRPSYYYRFRNRYPNDVVLKLRMTRENPSRGQQRVIDVGPYRLSAGQIKAGSFGGADRVSSVVVTCLERADSRSPCRYR